MFFSEPNYRFHFEIVVVLVIALIIYVFISIAWIVGQSLWRIQEKVNRHELTIADRDCISQRCKCQRTSLAICSDGPCLQYGEPGLETFRRLCKELKEKEKDVEQACKKAKDKEEEVEKASKKLKGKDEEVEKACKKLKDIIENLGTCYWNIHELQDEPGKMLKSDVKASLSIEICSIRMVIKDMLNC